MLENLLQLVKDNAGEAIINNPAIPNEHNDAACETVAGSIFDSLKNYAGEGGLSSITNLFQGGMGENHSLLSGISGNVIGNLMSKFNLSADTAGGLVKALVPNVMNNLINKTNDPDDDSFDLQGIVSSLTGGGGSGLLNTLKGLFN